MTREEAIQILRTRIVPTTNWQEIHEAIDMAIEALSAEAPKPTGELIARADAIEAVRMSEHRITIADEQGGVGTVKWDMWGVYTAEAVEAIKALPPAEAVEAIHDTEWVALRRNEYKDLLASTEAVQGEWKPFDLTWGRNDYFCTACQESTEVPTVNGQPSYNFCPNCGAKMFREDGEA